MTSTVDPPDLTAGTKAPRPAGPAPLVDSVRGTLGRVGHIRLRRVVVVLEGACVVLRGSVPTFYLKQIAQTAVQVRPGDGAGAERTPGRRRLLMTTGLSLNALRVDTILVAGADLQLTREVCRADLFGPVTRGTP